MNSLAFCPRTLGTSALLFGVQILHLVQWGKPERWPPGALQTPTHCFHASHLNLLRWGFKWSWQISLCFLGTISMRLETRGMPTVWLFTRVGNFFFFFFGGEKITKIAFALASIMKLGVCLKILNWRHFVKKGSVPASSPSGVQGSWLSHDVLFMVSYLFRTPQTSA